MPANFVIVKLDQPITTTTQNSFVVQAATGGNATPPDPAVTGELEEIILADAVGMNATKRERCSYTTLTDNGDGTFTLSGVTRNIDGSGAQTFTTGWVYQAVMFDHLRKGPRRDCVASGALADGTVVSLRSDGKVEASGVTNYDASIGATTVFYIDYVDYPECAYDSTNGKVLVIFRESRYTGDLRAVVGTVTGDTISFGSSVQIAPWIPTIDAFNLAFDATAGKFVVGYTDNTYKYAVVATISGTTVTFGTPVKITTGNGYVHEVVYDSINNKTVIFFTDFGAGSTIYGIVGTVSGDTISFGTATQISTSASTVCSAAYDTSLGKIAVTQDNNCYVGTVSADAISFGTAVSITANTLSLPNAVYDSTAGKVVIIYNDNTALDTKAVVGTISGTTITFGATAQVTSEQYPYESSAVYDPDLVKVVITYVQETSLYGRVTSGVVSGDTIAFDTPVTFSSDTMYWICSCYDTTQNKVVIFYDGPFGTKGTGCVLIPAYSVDNTADVLGIIQATTADAATGAVALEGSIDDSRSGLIPKATYYVADDGSLTTTVIAGRKIGRAITSTELLIELG